MEVIDMLRVGRSRANYFDVGLNRYDPKTKKLYEVGVIHTIVTDGVSTSHYVKHDEDVLIMDMSDTPRVCITQRIEDDPHE